MANLSDYLENALINHISNNAVYTAPATLYVALYTTAPTDSTAGVEVLSGRGYARQTVTLAAASGGATSNTNTISFGPNTAANWGTVVAAAVVDSGTIGAGNILLHNTLNASRAAIIGDRIEFAPGALTFSLA